MSEPFWRCNKCGLELSKKELANSYGHACSDPVETPAPPTPEDFEKAYNEVTAAFLKASLELLYLQKHEEFNFFKKTITFGNGGVYLLQIQHVAGPKLNVQTDLIKTATGEVG